IDRAVLVCPTGGKAISLAAYDRMTGKRMWRNGRDEAGYASPMLATVGSTKQVLNYTEHGVTAHDPTAGGAVLWYYEWTNSEKVVCSQPIANAGAPDQVLLTVGYGKGSVLLKVARETDGTW